MEQTRRASPPARSPRLGEVVFYVPSGTPVRAALVIHVHSGGLVVDLVVLGEGDPRHELTRSAWAHGQGLTRARLDVAHWSQARGSLSMSGIAWAFPEELEPAPLERVTSP